LLISQRRYDEAIPLVEESKRVMTAAGALHALPFVRLQEARATLGKGNADQAVEILSEIFDALIESGDTYEAPETAVHLAEALVESGREKEAEEKLDVLELRASDDAERVTGGILRIRGLARASQNKLDEAGELLERALNHAIEDGDLFGEALSRAALAELAVRGGSTQDAASLERTNEIHGILGIVA
ncbi:MAG: tetratricopeptide repeat protein, partial [Anaerolineae bacterium]|nr:tetratricopeptide repeat protein [Anaerolineae bacterium]